MRDYLVVTLCEICQHSIDNCAKVQGRNITYTGFARKRGYKRYRAQTADCRSCPLRKQCIGTSAQGRLIERHLHEDAIQNQKEITGTPEYYAAMRLRKIWCEGNFSHQKERHNLKRTRKRGSNQTSTHEPDLDNANVGIPEIQVF